MFIQNAQVGKYDEQFINAMHGAGIPYNGQILANGQIHRFHDSKKKSQNQDGWYVFFGKAGAFGNHKNIHEKWSALSNPTQSFSDEEKSQIQQEINASKKLSDEERLRKQNEIAEEATQIWEKASETGDSNYLRTKQVEAHGLRYSNDKHGDFVAVPLRDTSGKLWSLQKIYAPKPDNYNNKWLLTGGRKRGCFHTIGTPLTQLEGTTVSLCEGYATGASVHMATGVTVIVAFDSGNIEPVMREITKTYPNLSIVIAADNDCWREDGKNPGLEAANEASQKYGCLVVHPKFKQESHTKKPTDFNDLNILDGIEEVKKQMHKSLQSKIEEWAEPLSIKHKLLEVEPVSPEMIPVPMQEFITDVAYRMQCPPDFVLIPTLVLISSLIGSGCGVMPKLYDTWTVVPNLWGGIVGDPSTLKSPSLKEALGLLVALDKKAREDYEDALAKHQIDKEWVTLQQEAIKSDFKKKAKTTKLTQIEEGQFKSQLLDIAISEPPYCKRYIANDTTIEKIHELLSRNPRGILLNRDELVGLLESWEKEGRETDRAFYLESWNGYGSYTVDRIGRGTLYVDNLCISILGSTQPDKLLGYLNKNIQGLGNDGLLQRFQLLVYPDPVKKWELIDIPPNTDAKNRIKKIVEDIASMDFIKKAAEVRDGSIPYFRFSEEAQQLFFEWLTELETQKLRSTDDEPIIIEHLAKYRKLMPALSLIFHVIHMADGHTVGPISLEATKLSILWCEYLESHARRIYDMALNVSAKAAFALSKKIIQGKLEGIFTARDVHRKGWSLLNKPSDAEAACEELVKSHWLREIYTPPAQSKKAKTEYQINPRVRTNNYG